MFVKPILIMCTVWLLAACSSPAPTPAALPTASPAPTRAATLTPSPVKPTATPLPSPTMTPTRVPRLSTILARGKVMCGVDAARPDLADFDTDICRALAAALFDNPDAVEARPLDLPGAVAALASGEIDVNFGPTDYDQSGLHNGPMLFFDATGAMAREDSGIRVLTDLRFTTLCLIQDSIDERVFSQAAQAARVKVQPLLFNAGEIDTMYKRYDQGHCDAVVDNRVRLAQRLPQLSDPRGQALIDVTLVIGPRGPLTSSNDANWTHIVDALSRSLIRAEALGITSANLAKALASVDPDVRQLLGVEGSTGVELGLTKDYAAQAIGRVGNYGEIYARHFDAEAGIHLPRGPNALIKDGGLIAAP